MMTKMTFNLILILALFLTSPSLLHAQPPPPNDPESAPIDGGLTLLLGAGAAAAAWRFRQTKG
ncbi:MAG: hypothetical protein EBS53_17385 [Bacteroidetes bacterium]|nr:hypothetical protein [Bacteroidota bacterium]